MHEVDIKTNTRPMSLSATFGHFLKFKLEKRKKPTKNNKMVDFSIFSRKFRKNAKNNFFGLFFGYSIVKIHFFFKDGITKSIFLLEI